MRILAFSDIHGSYEIVEEILSSESEYDLVILAGDITTCGTPAEMESALRLFKAHNRPLLGVTGNMDPPALDETLENAGVSLNGRGVIVAGVGLCGVGASPLSPLKTPNEIPEEEIMRRAREGWKSLAGASWKIFVPHAPPRDTKVDRTFMGRHVGSASVRLFIEEQEPEIVICGHIHEARGTDSIGRTKIINCGPSGKGYYGVVTIGTHPGVELKKWR